MSRFVRQLGFELLKLFARKRTYLGFGAFIIVELLVLLGMQLPGPHRMLARAVTMEGLDFSHYFSGLTLAYNMVTWSVFSLGSLYLALVCGDIVAKEVEDGTMRMVLSRPVSRVRILALKYVACVFYTVGLTVFIVLTSLALGILDKGVGGLIVMAPWEHVFGFYEAGPGFGRIALATVVLGFSLLTLATLGFMFSCFNVKPASATVLTLTVYLVDDILRGVPQFIDLRGYFLTHHMAVWQHVFERVIPWPRIFHSMGYLAVFDLAALAIATLYFLKRDFKS